MARGKWRQGAIAVLALGLGAGAAGLAWTNPTQAEYERYAATELRMFLQANVCKQAPQELGLRQECAQLLARNEGKLQQIIAEKTDRVNFYLFSLYLTQLSPTDLLDTRWPVASFLPSYRVEAVGFAHRFQIYQTKRTN